LSLSGTAAQHRWRDVNSLVIIIQMV